MLCELANQAFIYCNKNKIIHSFPRVLFVMQTADVVLNGAKFSPFVKLVLKLIKLGLEFKIIEVRLVY